ncbi:MAG: hypothetical protein EOL95_09305 [Bacteroidia bacterium]|nr:hypothetical protein [Bacteroidia bacterium]
MGSYLLDSLLLDIGGHMPSKNKKNINYKEEPTLHDIRFAVCELNRVCQFTPALRTSGKRDEIISSLMLVQDQLDISDSKYLNDISNWTLMQLGVGPWRTKTEKTFRNPYKSKNKLEIKIATKAAQAGKKKRGINEEVKDIPLGMQTFNPFLDTTDIGSQIIFQYLEDPSQCYSEVIRKMQQTGFLCTPEYARVIMANARKVLRYFHLYQGYNYGLKKRKEYTEEEMQKMAKEIYYPKKPRKIGNVKKVK